MHVDKKMHPFSSANVHQKLKKYARKYPKIYITSRKNKYKVNGIEMAWESIIPVCSENFK